MPRQFTQEFTQALVLVGCVKAKAAHRAPARQLYTSAWFKKARNVLEASGANWLILSARYGLLEPHTEIEPYDRTLRELGTHERKLWAAGVLEALQPHIVGCHHVIFLAGHRYREFLIKPLIARNVEVSVPMEGLRLGEQLAWLSQQQITTRR